MDLLKTGIGITKTIKNVTRSREIVTVFWRNGLDEFIIKTNLHKVIPGFALPIKRINKALLEEKSESDIWQSIGFRLRKSFEELGPSFIKLGQLLATREDLFEPSFTEELKKLQDRAQGIDFSIAKEAIEKTLGKKLEEVFSEFNETPIGVASIGVVYKAKLLSGEDVVVKLRRPNINKVLVTDFEIIHFLVEQLEKFSEEIKYLGVSRAIEDFFKSTQLELNFHIEANNGKILKENLKKYDKENLFLIPTIYEEYTCENLLVMEYIEGTPFNKLKGIDETAGLEKKLNTSVSYFIKNLLTDGFFHADLHGGNFFLLNDGRIGIIDFGLMGNLSRKSRINLVAILYAITTKNFENLVYEFLDVADYDTIPNTDQLIRDIQDALSPFLGLSIQETDISLMFSGIIKTLSKHQLYLPREWFIIFRALMTLDGVGKSLNFDINIFEFINEEINEIVNSLFNKNAIIEDAVWVGRDTLNSLRTLPRHLKWMMKEISHKKYVLDVNLIDVKDELSNVSRALFFMGLMVFASVLSFIGAYFLKDMPFETYRDVPAITWIFWTGGILTVFRAAILFRK